MTRIAILLALAAATLPAQAVRVFDDRRAEVLGILFRVAGAPDFAGGGVEPYLAQVDSAFAPYRADPVFAEINRLRHQYPIALSDIVSLAPQLTDPITFGERTPIDAPTSTLAPSWHGAAARPFLADARAFAKTARLAAFLKAHEAVFDSATARMKRLIDSRGHLDWFPRFYGEPSRGLFIVSPLVASSGGSFGADFYDGATHERYAYLGVPGSDSAGYPTLSPETLPTVIHELSHSYVNHILDSARTQFAPAGAVIFPVVQAQMRRLAYASAQIMFNESLVRASVIRYLLDNEGRAAARTETRVQQGLGFVWMGQLVELLGNYETHRTQYPTFGSFVPRLVSFFNEIAPGVERLEHAYEQHRPRIIRTSIANGARNVDPALRELAVTFDRPVSTTLVLKGVLAPGLPELTGARFDSTRTVLTIGIRLQPGTDYDIPFGPGFFSDDGYPNQRRELSFHTGPTR